MTKGGIFFLRPGFNVKKKKEKYDKHTDEKFQATGSDNIRIIINLPDITSTMLFLV